jgi:hypothetical protein
VRHARLVADRQEGIEDVGAGLATGVDPQHEDNTQRRNVYAGLLLGFALSLLLPFVNSIRRVKQGHASGGTT